MRFIRENGKFYAVKGFFKKELSFYEMTRAMADIAALVQNYVAVDEEMKRQEAKE